MQKTIRQLMDDLAHLDAGHTRQSVLRGFNRHAKDLHYEDTWVTESSTKKWPTTDAEIRAFQRAHPPLAVDGKIGQKTLAVLTRQGYAPPRGFAPVADKGTALQTQPMQSSPVSAPATASSGGYQALGPDGKTMVGLTGAPDGTQFGQDHSDKPKTRDNGTRVDKFGNTPSDYIAQDTVSVTGTIGLTPGGSFADEIQKLESARGTGLRLNQSWAFKNSTLAVLEGERADADNQRVWTNLSRLGSFNMGDEIAQFYQKYGYKLSSDKDSVTPGKIGTFRTEEQQLTKGGKDVIVRNSFALFAFESAKGKGLHLIQVSFVGSGSDYASGGLEAMNALLNSLGPTANVKPATVNSSV